MKDKKIYLTHAVPIMLHVGHDSQVPFAKQDTVELPSGLYPVLQLITAISPYVVMLSGSTTSALIGLGIPHSRNKFRMKMVNKTKDKLLQWFSTNIL